MKRARSWLVVNSRSAICSGSAQIRSKGVSAVCEDVWSASSLVVVSGEDSSVWACSSTSVIRPRTSANSEPANRLYSVSCASSSSMRSSFCSTSASSSDSDSGEPAPAPEIEYRLSRRIDVRECETSECSEPTDWYFYYRDEYSTYWSGGSLAPELDLELELSPCTTIYRASVVQGRAQLKTSSSIKICALK